MRLSTMMPGWPWATALEVAPAGVVVTADTGPEAAGGVEAPAGGAEDGGTRRSWGWAGCDETSLGFAMGA